MKNIFSLDKLKVGEKGYVVEINIFTDLRRRLFDIGLIEGTKIECVGKSPSNNPYAYLIRGTVIALRQEDSKNITIKFERC